jgi:hypothetical protein
MHSPPVTRYPSPAEKTGRLYFTIVEAMFALDGNSYITKWPIVMYLKNTGRNSTFRGKFFRREVSPSSRSLPTNSQTKSLRSKRRISLVFSSHLVLHSYQPSFATIDSNVTNYGNYDYRNYKRKVKYFMGYDKGEILKMNMP